MSQLVALNDTRQAVIGNTTITRMLAQVLRETQLGEWFPSGEGALRDSVTFVDMRHLSGQYSKEYWRGAYFLEPATWSIRPVRRYLPEEGSISWDEPLSGVAFNYGYFLIRWPHPTALLAHIVDTFNNDVWLPTVSATSYCPDFDMELHPDSAASWWDADPGVDVEKNSTPPLPHGLRCLKVTATSNAGAVHPTAGFAVVGNKGYHLSVLAHVGGNTTGAKAYIELKDQETGAVIQRREWNGKGWARLYIDLEIPEATKLVDVHLGIDTVGQYARFKDLIFYPYGEHNIPLPGWVREADQVKKVFKLSPEAFQDPDLWLSSFQGHNQAGWVPLVDKFSTSQPGQLTSHVAVLEDPLYFVARRQLDIDGPYIGGEDYRGWRYDTLVETTFNINPTWFMAALKLRLYNSMDAWPGSASYDKDWLKAQKTMVERQKNQCMMSASREMDRFLTADDLPRQYHRNFYGR